MTSKPIFKTYCPSGGTFYACDYGARFLGCSTSDDQDKVCKTGPDASELKPASFESQYYEYVPAGSCWNSNDTSWWVCADTLPPFLGCCELNPCTNGCPDGRLMKAITPLDVPSKTSYSLIESPGAAPSTYLNIPTAQQYFEILTGPIIGGVIGGVGFGAILGAMAASLILYYRRRKVSRAQNRKNEQDGNDGVKANPPSPTPVPAYTPSPPSGGAFSISDSPRTAHEMPSVNPAGCPVRSKAANRFTPYSPAHVSTLTNSSGLF